ncbi:hypothetical protein, partial [Escherichia coli]|uniref:hypothetical protein n=2 Tax=Escherichia coli TaxID=562 RepID=UPI0023A96A16
IFLRQKQKKLIMLPSEILIWQPEFTDKTLSRKPGAVQATKRPTISTFAARLTIRTFSFTRGKTHALTAINKNESSDLPMPATIRKGHLRYEER